MFHLISAVFLLFHSPAPDFRENLAYWQRALQLQDWRISVVLVRADELDHNAVGEMDVEPTDRTASIRILREQDSDLPRRLARADQQLTLVHELVHLKRRVDGDAWRNEAETVAQTTALVLAHRRRQEAAAIEGL